MKNKMILVALVLTLLLSTNIMRVLATGIETQGTTLHWMDYEGNKVTLNTVKDNGIVTITSDYGIIATGENESDALENYLEKHLREVSDIEYIRKQPSDNRNGDFFSLFLALIVFFLLGFETLTLILDFKN